MRSHLLGGALAALAAPAAALAQPAASVPSGPVSTERSRVTSYDAAYFAQFAPRTALDIVRRVPGFLLDSGGGNSVSSVDVRGFAGAAGNVVFNGARPSSKAETVETLLQRIPAQRVQKVELGPGDLYGSDYAGKSQVLNIVMSAEAGFDANVTASARRLYEGSITHDLSGSALIRRGSSSINLSAGLGRNQQEEEGTDSVVDLSNGVELEKRRKFNSYINRDPYLAGSWAREDAADRALRANIRWSPSKFDLEQRNRVTPLGGDPHDDSLFQRYRNPVIELGGDVTRPLAGGAIKLVGLATRRKRNDRDQYIERDGLLVDDPFEVGGFEQNVRARRGETIARLSWTHGDLSGFSVQTGIEGALNTLDYAVEYFETDDGVRARIDLPIDQATVKEKRAEAFVSLGRSLSPALRIDGGLNYEFSSLRVRGDASADRTLRFLKPNIAIDWKPAAGWHARLSARRTVAQLNFYDFVSFAELSNDRVNGGNAELLPQRTWELRATVDRSIFGSGLVKLDLGIDRVSLLQDQILTEDGFSAPGNLGTGKRRFARLSLDTPLAPLGLAGTSLKANILWQRTRVFDPISGRERKFSDYFPDVDASVELRRDAGRFSYGTTVAWRDDFAFFRSNEIDRSFNGGIFGTAFFEYRATPRTSIVFDIDNLFNTSGNRERLFFDPNRSAPDPAFRELRLRDRHRAFGLTVKQSFGGAGGVANSGG